MANGLALGVCDVPVTNVCNATCDFCSFARDQDVVRDKRWIELAGFTRALPLPFRRGIRYVNFQGGEPLMHPEIEAPIIGESKRQSYTRCLSHSRKRQFGVVIRQERPGFAML